MLKNIETCDEVIIKKMAKLPIDIAAEVLMCYCTSATTQCILVGIDGGEEYCPFADTHCSDITKDMWEEYLNG
jgi:hypothetical protein